MKPIYPYIYVYTMKSCDKDETFDKSWLCLHELRLWMNGFTHLQSKHICHALVFIIYKC